MNGEESQSDGAGYVAPVRVDFCVEFFERTGAICCSELKHVVHSVNDLVKYENYLAVYKRQAFEGAFDARLGAAERKECFGRAERCVSFAACVLEAKHESGSGSGDVDLFG